MEKIAESKNNMEKKITEGADNKETMTDKITQMMKEKSKPKGPWDKGKQEALSRYIASRKWDDVIQLYENYPQSRDFPIDKYSGDTAIHVAISDQQQWRVKEMVTIVEIDVLKIGNNQENTPLHLAASLGSTDVCRWIAKKGKDSNLTSLRNQNGETPLFLAVANGNMDAFCYLLRYRKDEKEYFKRENGDTILHAAISGQHFDIAYCIIHEYPKLVHEANKQGESPLHLLAAMPSAFKSGNPLIGLSKLIYHCIPVGDTDRVVDQYRKNCQQDEEAAAFERVDRSQSDQQDEAVVCGGPEGKICDAALIYLLLPIVFMWTTVYWVIKWVIQRIFSLLMAVFKLVMCIPDRQENKDAASKKVDHEKNIQQDEEAASEQVDHSESHQQNAAGDCGQGLWSKITTDAVWQVFVIWFICVIVYSVIILVIKYMLSLVMAVFNFVKFISGYKHYVSLKHLKERCTWSVHVMNKLIDQYENKKQGDCTDPTVDEHQDIDGTFGVATTKMEKPLFTAAKHGVVEMDQVLAGTSGVPTTKMEKPLFTAAKPAVVEMDQDLAGTFGVPTTKNFEQMETPLLVAAKHGVLEMVECILDIHPNAIFQVSTREKKNIVMLAAENRHPHLYEYLLQKPRTIFQRADNHGNNVLHFAAKLGNQRPWRNIRGAALQMHMEVKWYNYVKDSMPYNFASLYNKEHEPKSPENLFEESHKDLKKEAQKWLTDNSQSCTFVVSLIATVAFATSATFPGGFKDTGTPALENDLVFIVSAITSLVALCSSMISVVMFLGILTSSFQQADFLKDLPIKHLVAMVSLLVSILSMSVSFLAGHQFVLKQKLKIATLPVYLALCVLLLFFIIINFPLDYLTVRTILRRKPQQCGRISLYFSEENTKKKLNVQCISPLDVKPRLERSLTVA